MGDPRAPAFDPEMLLGALNRHGVAYVLVGGFAARALGAKRPTTDIDVCAQWTNDNLDRLAAALRELGAGLRVQDDPAPFPVPIDARLLGQLELSTWRTPHGDIDVLRGLPSGQRQLVPYDQLLIRAEHATLDGVAVAIASLDDIIRSKEVTDRPPDREALPELRQLRASMGPETEATRNRLEGPGRGHDPSPGGLSL